MTIHDDDRLRDDGVTESQMSRRPSRRRARAVVGAAGLAAVLGGGAYLVTLTIADDRSTAIRETGGSAPLVAASPPAAEPTASASATASATPASAASALAASIPPDVRDKIEAARRKMADDGVEVARPVLPQTTATADDIKLTTKGSLKEGGILRIVTARGDLTGQRELAWVAGGVEKYRNTSCSQTFQFSTNPVPTKKPNLLLCWNTSAEKSVIAIVVDPKGHPSRDKAVDAVEKKWRSMG
jgi:hypothetical protein